jgi:GNAT superfamily N-acetyltransferase
MIEIFEYKDVDPLRVLNTTLLALDFQFSPEHAEHIRRSDPRPFPCFTVNAVENGQVLGQVGVFKLPMISTKGREDVGGVWAVSTHPNYSGRGIASRLLDEAHARMLEAGLRFSTLGTDRYRVSYRLYQRHGYVDMNIWASALASWETAHQPTRLNAFTAESQGYEFVENLFSTLATDYLGFSWRHTPFARLRDRVPLNNIWLLSKNNSPVGFVFARIDRYLVRVNIQTLRQDIDAVEVVAAVISELKAPYVQVSMSRPSDIASFRRAGYQVAHPTWGAFMIKPLTPDATIERAQRLFGIGTDQFLISWLDTT